MNAAGGYRNYTARARRIARLLDALSFPALPFLRRLAPRGAPPAIPRSILVVRLDHLGDVLMTTPAIAALRRAYPRSRIDALVAPWGRAAVEGNPDIDALRVAAAPWYDPSQPEVPDLRSAYATAVELHREGYDWAFDFRGDPRVIAWHLLPAARRRFGFARLGLERLLTDSLPYERRRSMLDLCIDLVARAGVPSIGRRPVFRVGDEDRAAAARLLEEAGIPAAEPPVVVAPSANRAPARWTPAGFAAVVSELAAGGRRVLLVGRAEDAPVNSEVGALSRGGAIDLTGRTSLRQLAAVLERAALLVGNDSGPIHLAASVNCPTVAVFGPTDPEITFPYEDGDRFVSVRSRCDHPRPCLNPGCASDHGFPALPPAEVLAAARGVLSRRSLARSEP